MKRWLSGLAIALLVIIGGSPNAGAHPTVPEPMVEMFVKPDGDRLTVLVRLPIAVLSDANLPRDASGRLVPETSGPPLQLVARDIASNLELQQNDDLLPSPAIATSMAANGEFVEVVLTYSIRAGAGGITARLRTFRAGTGIVRTVAHYDAPATPTRTFTVAGDPERVAFDPRLVEVVRTFVARGTAALLSGGDALLFALCLALPLRREGALRAASIAFLTGEIATILICGAGGLLATPQSLATSQVAAASAIVVVALQVVTNPRSQWLAALALIFGLAHGLATGAAFLRDTSLGGSHVATALMTFLLVVTLGQIWMIALLSSAAALLFRWGLPERLAAVAAAIFVGHEALHRIADRGDALALLRGTTSDQILMTVTLIWAGLILCAGSLELVWLRRARAFAASPAPDEGGRAGS